MSAKTSGPVVVDGHLQYTSVSAMQKFDACPRAWWYRYVKRLPDKPEGKGILIGKAAHARLDHYYKTGENVLGPIERVGMARGLLPTPGADLFSEHEIKMCADGVRLIGYIDLVNLRGAPMVSVTDWKFKKDLAAYGHKKEDLIDVDNEAGIQMLGYAAYALVFNPLSIELRHVQFQYTGRIDVEEIKITISVDDAKARWESVVGRIIPPMRASARCTEASQVTGKESACDKYGGCAYRATCMDPMARLRRGFLKVAVDETNEVVQRKETQMGMMQDMLKKQAAPVADVPPTQKPPPPPVVVDTPPTAPPPEKKKERRLNIGHVQHAPDELPLVTPPDMPAPTQVKAYTATTSAEVTTVQLPTTPQTEAQMIAALQASLEANPIRCAAVGTVSEPEKKKKGKKAEGAPTLVVEAVVPVAPVAAPTGGIHLYFGCSPVGVKTESLLQYVYALDAEFSRAAQIKAVHEEDGVFDLRCVGGQEFGFGKWKGFLAQLARERPPPAGHYIVTRGDERVEVVAESLTAVAALVVRS